LVLIPLGGDAARPRPLSAPVRILGFVERRSAPHCRYHRRRQRDRADRGSVKHRYPPLPPGLARRSLFAPAIQDTAYGPLGERRMFGGCSGDVWRNVWRVGVAGSVLQARVDCRVEFGEDGSSRSPGGNRWEESIMWRQTGMKHVTGQHAIVKYAIGAAV